MHLYEEYKRLEENIDQKYEIFSSIWELGSSEILPELIFCLCTPQTNAKLGWKATQAIFISNVWLLEDEPAIKILENILGESGVRFKNKKSKYILEVFRKFENIDLKHFINTLIKTHGIIGTRNWLAKNIKGFGMKEASHFLRNIGLGDDIAILDRHILNCLKTHAGITVRKSLNNKEYERIEMEMKKFADKINIPLFALDFVFWAEKHSGEIFK